MKVSYTTGHSTYTVLGDESDRSALFETFAPSFAQQSQQVPLARSATAALYNRGNVVCTLTIEVSIPYSTPAAALAALRTLRGVLASKLHLKVEHSTETQYYPNAACIAYAPVLRGKTVQHRFTFITQDVTATAPSVDPT